MLASMAISPPGVEFCIAADTDPHSPETARLRTPGCREWSGKPFAFTAASSLAVSQRAIDVTTFSSRLNRVHPTGTAIGQLPNAVQRDTGFREN